MTDEYHLVEFPIYPIPVDRLHIMTNADFPYLWKTLQALVQNPTLRGITRLISRQSKDLPRLREFPDWDRAQELSPVQLKTLEEIAGSDPMEFGEAVKFTAETNMLHAFITAVMPGGPLTSCL